MRCCYYALSNSPLLEEADEGRDPCAGSDHHEGHRQVSGGSKGAGGPQAHVDLRCGRAGGRGSEGGGVRGH